MQKIRISQIRNRVSYIILLCSIILNSDCYSQKSKDCVPIDVSFISNKTINYTVVLMACDTCVPIKNIGYRVIIEMPDNEIVLVKKIKKGCWESLLSDENTDWAANLLLYNLYNKDAIILSRTDITDWKKYQKAKDIKMWKKKIKK